MLKPDHLLKYIRNVQLLKMVTKIQFDYNVQKDSNKACKETNKNYCQRNVDIFQLASYIRRLIT